MRDALVALGVALGGFFTVKALRAKAAPPSPPGGPRLSAVGEPNIT